ncbi:hypothetical protein IFM61392_09513 [Aspergillus lentulus]|nr:hypothetical protein IFM61392_09513 [Aspergillus lentulus]
MNTTIPAIRSSEPLCPLDERRTKTQLLVKLFVVHFTTIGAFFHLLNVRGEYFLSLRPIFYICTPMSFIAQHVIAAATLILRIPLVCIRDRRYPNIEKDLIRPVKSILGKLGDPSTESGAESQLESEAGRVRESRNEFRERAIRRLGRVLVTVAFLVQCSLSLLLYHRRKTHGPDTITLIDEKVFQLAASGTLVGLLTLGVTLRFPGFGLSNPACPSSTKIERVMIYLGHRGAPILSQSLDTFNPVVGFFALSITSCLVLHACGRIHPMQEFISLWKDFGDPETWTGEGFPVFPWTLAFFLAVHGELAMVNKERITFEVIFENL